MLPGLSSTARFAAATLALIAMSQVAHADEAAEEIVVPRAPSSTTAPKQVIIIVQKTAPSKTQGGAPQVGDSAQDINEYLRGLEREQRDTRDRIKDASRDDDDTQVDLYKEQLKEQLRTYKVERDRLTTRDGGLIAGGATLTAVGGASLVASLFLGFAYALSNSFGSHGDEGLGYAAIATLGGGVVGLGAGIPMLAVGLKRVPRELDAEYAPPATSPALGGTLVWQF